MVSVPAFDVFLQRVEEILRGPWQFSGLCEMIDFCKKGRACWQFVSYVFPFPDV